MYRLGIALLRWSGKRLREFGEFSIPLPQKRSLHVRLRLVSPTDTPATVLVVEDDPTIADIVKFTLEREGYSVLTAADARGAMTLVDACVPDMTILEISLPDGTGIDILRHLRVELRRVEPVLMLSGYHQEDMVVRALELGANDYVIKPFSPRELAARVRRSLAR